MTDLPRFDIALCTTDRFEVEDAGDWYVANIFEEDRLLIDALRALGISATRVSWSRPDFDWSSVDLVLPRTTWDWFDRFEEFRAWIDHVTSRATLVNTSELVLWNLDKHYLHDIGRRGVPIVPTTIVEAGDPRSLHDGVAALPSAYGDEFVLKPVVSAAGRDTYRIGRHALRALEPLYARLVASEALIVQPFQPAVQVEGEISVIVLGSVASHAVLKTPREGEFRVQDDHGGKVAPHVPSPEEAALAVRAVAACHPSPVYARVDVVRDDAGALAVMELEVVEPELFFRFHPPAAERLANLLAELHGGGSMSRAPTV